MLERSLVILRPLNDPRVIVELIAFLGTVMTLTGDYARAAELFGEGREKAVAVGDQWFAAMCLSLQGSVAMHTGRYEVAHEQLQSAVAEWRVIGDPRFTAFGLNFLGQIALTLGRYAVARAALEESVALNLSVGARWNLGHAPPRRLWVRTPTFRLAPILRRSILWCFGARLVSLTYCWRYW